ncbi:Trehalose-phosphatase [Choanephora cucurbitarum]|uniref:Trehalose-phosphatase n=1 Tax=Choanephora cucurbitarum TaxID=101091 RepID=A0A1C7NEX2_9FUNG|nr:Trehalose-phosphatase [Choanephora cucurbitarum]
MTHSPGPKRGRLINLTHQLPYEVTLDDNNRWSFIPRRGHGAMYGGIHSLQTDWDTFFIGWTGRIHRSDIHEITESEKNELMFELRENYRCIPLFLEDKAIEGHYDGYCKSVLWPLFHYIIWSNVTDGRLEEKQWDEYVAVNKKYADFVCDIYRDEDIKRELMESGCMIIICYWFRLWLELDILEQKLACSYILLFQLLKSFGAYQASAAIRKIVQSGCKAYYIDRKEVLKGMIGANLIGFQTYAYARHFISTCTRILGNKSTPEGLSCADGHFCHVNTFPIGINPDEIEARCQNLNVQAKVNAIREVYQDKLILIGRDKIDLVKGVFQKLAAFERFLVDFPEWKDKVVMIQLTEGTTSESTKLEHKVSEFVARINKEFGSLAFFPVHHYHRQIDVDEYYALLIAADVAVITANRDGMNTTSLEYVICQRKKHGPLILSELTGTAGSLSSAIMVNPWDYTGVARAINDALLMTNEEKTSRHMQMLAHVKTHTSSYWAQSFVHVLEDSIATFEQSSYTPILDIRLVSKAYQSSKKRLFCFDYDGALSMIRKVPGQRLPTPDIAEGIQMLCNNPQNEVWVISSRDEAILNRWFGHISGIGLAAEHGSLLRNRFSNRWINLLEHFDMNWKHDVVDIFTYYAERTTGSFIEHKRCSVTWHYQLADPEYGEFQSRECQSYLENAILSKMPVEMIIGRKSLEVRPAITSKGEILKRILSTSSDVDFIMCFGNDKTEDNMYKILKKIAEPRSSTFSVVSSVKDKKTMADWRVQTVEDVLHAIKRLVSCSEEYQEDATKINPNKQLLDIGKQMYSIQ